MNQNHSRNLIKEALGRLPLTSEVFQDLRPEVVPSGSYAIPDLTRRLPGWTAAVQQLEPWIPVEARRRVLIIGNLKWWLEYGVVLGLLLTAAGHRVDLAFLPYRDWVTPVALFDARRGSRYLERHLQSAGIPLGLRSLMAKRTGSLPHELELAMVEQSQLDVQYTLQREDVDFDGDPRARRIYELRLARNRLAALNAYELLQDHGYDTVVIPNGSILEFGAVYRVASYLDAATVTYEFGEQRQRVWLAQNDEVMRQNTSGLWRVVKDIPLSPEEHHRIESLFQARRGGRAWAQFNRQWQAAESEGAQKARARLDLDPAKKMVLLCTNVVGDSLALNRQIFTAGMADWLRNTVSIFGDLHEYQLVVRVHPGELLGAGHPSVEIVRHALPAQPEHVIVVPPESEINTYDLIELAHLGLVYTTTVGLEMSMHGVPVVVAGSTHYRGKGFTDDPRNWDEYVRMLNMRLGEDPGRRMSEAAVELAWRYAYRFFFDYPFPIPWHLISFWDDLNEKPLQAALEGKNLEQIKSTVKAFAGSAIDWRAKVHLLPQSEVPVER